MKYLFIFLLFVSGQSLAQHKHREPMGTKYMLEYEYDSTKPVYTSRAIDALPKYAATIKTYHLENGVWVQIGDTETGVYVPGGDMQNDNRRSRLYNARAKEAKKRRKP